MMNRIRMLYSLTVEMFCSVCCLNTKLSLLCRRSALGGRGAWVGQEDSLLRRRAPAVACDCWGGQESGPEGPGEKALTLVPPPQQTAPILSDGVDHASLTSDGNTSENQWEEYLLNLTLRKLLWMKRKNKKLKKWGGVDVNDPNNFILPGISHLEIFCT